MFGLIIYYSQLLKRSQAAPPLRGQWIENASRQGRHYRLYSVMIRICVLTVLALLTCGLAHAGSYENRAKLYQHTDHLGSPVAGTDATGSVAWRERYTPYGEKLLKPDALNNQASFTGHIFDEPTGLTYMQARYYDPNIGRFLSIDPVTFMDLPEPGQFNRYAYTWNDPINATDPTGQVINIVGDKPYVAQVKKDIETIRNSGPEGAAAIDQLETSSNLHNISMPLTDSSGTVGENQSFPHDKAGAQDPKKGSASTTDYNPYDNTRGAAGSSTETQRPPVVGLAHELGHVQTFDNGTFPNDSTTGHVTPGGVIIPGSTPPNEVSPLRLENAVRRHLKIPERPHYSKK